MQHAVREELIGRNVAKLVSPPRADTAEIQPLDRAKAGRLIEHADKHWLRAAWLILLTTGLRRGEVLGLAWSDVDVDARTLRIRRTLQKIDGEFVFGEPKSKRSRRGLRLPILCAEALRAHPKVAAKRALPAQWRPLPHQPKDLIFVTRTGRPVDPRTFNRAFERLCARAGIDATRVHDLRHTCATLLLMDGVNEREVMELLGHSSITVTMNIYAHVLDEAKDALAARMDGLLGGD